jgi:hypothetical protein
LNWPVLLVAIVLACVAAMCAVSAARIWRRRRADEIRSIQGYHHRLDSLHVDIHDRGGSVKLVAGEPPPTSTANPSRPRLDPASAKLEFVVSGDAERVPRDQEVRHGRDWALGRSQPRARVENATVLVVAAGVAGLLVIGIVGYRIQRDRASTPAATTTTTSQPAPSTTTSVPAS